MKFKFFGTAKPAVILVIAFVFATLTTGKVHAQSSSTSISTDGDPSSSALTTLPEGNGTASSSARLDDMMSGFKKLPLSFIFYSRTDVKRALIADSTGSPTSFNFVGAGYNLSDTKSLIVRQEFNYDYPKLGAAGKPKTRDLYFGFNNTTLATFMGDGSVSSSSRVYLPTGEDSRYLTKQNGQIVEWLTASKPLGRFNLDVHLIGTYANQTQDSYVDTTSDKPKTTATLDYEVEQFSILTYNFSDRFAVYQVLGLDSLVMRPLPGDRALRSHFTESETGGTFKPNKTLSLTVSYFNYAPTNNADGGFALYRDSDSIYRFTVVAAI